MTSIVCTINKSGTNLPLDGYITVTSNNYLTSNTVFYTAVPVKYPLVAGTVTFDLLPSDVAKVAYRFTVVAVDTPSLLETIVWTFDAVVPFSAAPINMVTLAPQSGIRYDRRDASLLTLARFMVSNDAFISFLGSKLWNNKQTWSAVTVYQRGDVVFYNGSSYQYISTLQQANIIPGANPLIWTILAAKGDPGSSGAVAIGIMMLYPTGATLPPLYIRCDGAAISRTTYSALFAAIGTSYGAGDGTTTFNAPDTPVSGSSSFIIFTGV